MRSTRVNLTLTPREFFAADKNRGLISIRNLHATDTIFVQGGQSHKRDMYPILAGDILTLERGDISQSVWLCSDTVNHDDCVVVVT